MEDRVSRGCTSLDQRSAVYLDHVMKMRAGGKAAASDQTHDIATLDALPFFHQRLGKMAVQRFDPESVVELDHVPQFRIESHAGHTSLRGGLHGCIGGSADIEPIVPGWLFSERGHARSKP